MQNERGVLERCTKLRDVNTLHLKPHPRPKEAPRQPGLRNIHTFVQSHMRHFDIDQHYERKHPEVPRIYLIRHSASVPPILLPLPMS